MDAGQTLTDERMWTELETEIRPLVGVIRSALSERIFGPGDSVSDLLATVPIDTGARLADLWAAAGRRGSVSARLARFDPEEQFILELVTSVYSPRRPASPRFESAGLLDDVAVTPPPL